MFRNFRYDYPYQYQDYWYYFWRWGSYFPYGTYQGKYFRVNSGLFKCREQGKFNRQLSTRRFGSNDKNKSAF